MLCFLIIGVCVFLIFVFWVVIGVNVVGIFIVLGLVLVVNYDVVVWGFFNVLFWGVVEVV